MKAVADDNIYRWEENLLIKIAKRLREDCFDVSTNVYQYKDVKNYNYVMGAGIADKIINYKFSFKKSKKNLLLNNYYVN